MDFWDQRCRRILSQLETTTDVRARAALFDLAKHYDSMSSFCARWDRESAWPKAA